MSATIDTIWAEMKNEISAHIARASKDIMVKADIAKSQKARAARIRRNARETKKHSKDSNIAKEELARIII